MNIAADEHPEIDQLITYGQGRLGKAESEVVERHLDNCQQCCDTLLHLQDDTFMQRLRGASAPASTSDTASSRSPSSVTELPVDNNPPLEVPAALTEHSRYQILERIGRGGMGEVFRAKHTDMNRIVALKVVNPQLVQNRDARQRFEQEVRAAATLSHPNIVTAFDAEVAGEHQFLVMEFVQGQNLADVVHECGPLPVEDACAYIRQAASGLQHAFELEMVHRDIKPHNLMLVVPSRSVGGDSLPRAAQVRILDFGLSRFLSESEAAPATENPVGSVEEANTRIVERLTKHTTLMGTLDYISPEQARDARSADIRSDIYSLGCTLFFLLTGQPPFPGRSPGPAPEFEKTGKRPRLGDFRDDIPDGLEEIIEQMIAASPADRFSEPADIVTVLGPFTSDVVAQHGTTPHQIKTWVSARILAALVGITLLAGVVIVFKTGTGTIEVRAYGQGTKIEIDGKLLEDGQNVVTLKVGEHDIKVTDIDGITIQDEKVAIRWRGSTVPVEIQPEPRPQVLTLSQPDHVVTFEHPIRSDSLTFDSSGESLIASPEGKPLVVNVDGEQIDLGNVQRVVKIDLDGNERPIEFAPRGRSQGINAITPSRDGRFVFLINYDYANGELTRIELETGRTDFCPLVPRVSNTWAGKFALTPDGERLVVLCGTDSRPAPKLEDDLKNDSVAILDVSDGNLKLIKSLPLPDEAQMLAISNESAWLFARPRRSSSRMLYELSLTEFKLSRTLEFPGSDLAGCAIVASPKHGRLFIADASVQAVHVVDLTTFQISGRLELLNGVRSGGMAVSPDESLLAVLAPEHRKLWCVDPVSGQLIGGASGLPANTHTICFSTDGRRIAVSNRSRRNECHVFETVHLLRRYVYASTKAGGSFELYASDTTGLGMLPLTGNGATNVSPRWSPNGRQIAFITNQTGPNRIATIQRDGTRQRIWDGTDTGLANTGTASLDWSPDGRQIAFIGKGSLSVRILDTGTGRVRPLGRAPENHAWISTLTWPEKRGILITAADPGNAFTQTIFELDPQTGQSSILLEPKPDWVIGSPALSPDGRLLALRAAHDTEPDRPGGLALFTAVDGQFEWNPRFLVDEGPGVISKQFDPRWAPDGDLLVFEAEHVNGGRRVWLINADATGLRPIVPDEDVEVCHPDVWQFH